MDTKGRGFTIPAGCHEICHSHCQAGSLLVRSSVGTSKWVMPEAISKTLRPCLDIARWTCCPPGVPKRLSKKATGAWRPQPWIPTAR